MDFYQATTALEALKRMGGVTIAELEDIFNCETRHVYNRISYLRKKGYTIAKTKRHRETVYYIK
jgi:predicted HTH transcriptional regulator